MDNSDIFHVQSAAYSTSEIVAFGTRCNYDAYLILTFCQCFIVDGHTVVVDKRDFEVDPCIIAQTGDAAVGEVGKCHHVRMLEVVVMHVGVDKLGVGIALEEDGIDGEDVLSVGHFFAITVGKHFSRGEPIGAGKGEGFVAERFAKLCGFAWT